MSFSSPSSAPTKVHPRVELPELSDLSARVCDVLAFQTHADTMIAYRFTNTDFFVYDNLLTRPQSLATWIAIHNEIAEKLTDKPLFVFHPIEARDHSTEISFDDFSAHYAPRLPQDSSVTYSMMYFFRYLQRKMSLEAVD